MTVIAAVRGEHEPDRVVEVAFDIADTYGDDLVVLHVMPGPDFTERQLNRDDYFMDNAEADAENVARRVTRATLGSVEGVELVGKVGDVCRMILQAGDDLDARFLVVGGRKQTPLGKVIFGSTAQSVLLHADQPVVAVFEDVD